MLIYTEQKEQNRKIFIYQIKKEEQMNRKIRNNIGQETTIETFKVAIMGATLKFTLYFLIKVANVQVHTG